MLLPRSVVFMIALWLTGCGAKPGAAGHDTGASQPGSGADTARDSASVSGHHIPVDSTKPTLPPTIIPDDDAAGATTGVTATVAGVLTGPDLNGKSVRITGTCLGYRVPPVAVGAPPRTRSDWQLESAGQAIYVTGPLPAGCSATEGSSTPVTILATVREDTLAALGGNPPVPRRYLEWKGP